VVYHSDEPGGDIRGSLVAVMAQVTRASSDEVLCGRGADQIFGSSRVYVADRYAQALRAIPEALRKGVARLAGRLPTPSGIVLGRLLEGSLLDPAQAHFLWEGSRSGAHRELGLHGLPGIPENGEGVNRFLTADQLYSIPDDLVSCFDRLGLAHSLLVRLPFLDHRVVEFAARLPEEFKVSGNRTGVLLTALMKDRLPKQHLERRNPGYQMPVDDWFRTTLRPLLLETVTASNVNSTGVLEWPAIEASVQAHLEGRANLGYHLWGLVVLLLWMKRWGVQPPSRTADMANTAQPSLAI
jgi:asparagine synthase (glutamine-hydrolysing)